VIEVRLFGRFEVLRDGSPIPPTEWKRRKTQALLKVLLTDRGHVFPDDQLVEHLFPGTSLAARHANLRGRVSDLRRALEPDLTVGGRSQYILRLGAGYCFSSEIPCRLDLEKFQELLSLAERAYEEGHWSKAIEHLDTALALYRGELLEDDRYEEWSLAPRTHYAEERINALSRRADCHAELGELAKAIAGYREVLDARPTDEQTIRRLMTCHYVAGEDVRAIEVYEESRHVLKEHLDVEPSSETTALLEAIRRGDLPRKPMVLDPRRVAVLPFVNYCPNPDDESFVDGMTEELIYSLSKIGELKVISQTSVLAYRGAKKSVPQIGRELGVGTVVEGSVRKAEDTMRITVQLIDVARDEHLWAAEYDRHVGDVFEIQSEISQKVTQHLQGRLPMDGSAPALRYAGNPEAYRHFLEGRFHLKRRYKDSLLKARDALHAALETDDRFARAHAALAQAYWLLAHFGFLPRNEGYGLSESHARRALALDARAGEAHAALGAIQGMFRYDLRRAANHLDRAVKAEPQNMELRNTRAGILLVQGRVDAAITVYKEALELDPVSPLLNRSLGCMYYYARRYDDALVQLQRAERLETHDWSLHLYKGLTLLQMQQYQQAIKAFRASCDQDHPEEIEYDNVALAYSMNLAGEARALEQLVERMLSSRGGTAATLALGCFLLGDVDAGFEWLANSRDRHDQWYLYLLQDPLLDPVAEDPRFEEHLDSLGAKRGCGPP
jgi:TolB-like protein/Tfp pilus assembly protein PilF